MNEYLLNHIYQAWQQERENYMLDYKDFVIHASNCTGKSYNEILDFLKTCKWFKYISDE